MIQRLLVEFLLLLLFLSIAGCGLRKKEKVLVALVLAPLWRVSWMTVSPTTFTLSHLIKDAFSFAAAAIPFLLAERAFKGSLALLEVLRGSTTPNVFSPMHGENIPLLVLAGERLFWCYVCTSPHTTEFLSLFQFSDATLSLTFLIRVIDALIPFCTQVLLVLLYLSACELIGAIVVRLLGVSFDLSLLRPILVLGAGWFVLQGKMGALGLL
jgi:hypothetical protein